MCVRGGGGRCDAGRRGAGAADRARKLNVVEPRGLTRGLGCIAIGCATGSLAVTVGSPLLDGAALVLGARLRPDPGSCLVEVQRVVQPSQRAEATTTFYTLAYLGFGTPLLLAELNHIASYQVLLLTCSGVAQTRRLDPSQVTIRTTGELVVRARGERLVAGPVHSAEAEPTPSPTMASHSLRDELVAHHTGLTGSGLAVTVVDACLREGRAAVRLPWSMTLRRATRQRRFAAGAGRDVARCFPDRAARQDARPRRVDALLHDCRRTARVWPWNDRGPRGAGSTRRSDAAGHDPHCRPRFTGRVAPATGGFEAEFDPGPIGMRDPTADEVGAVLEALHADPGIMASRACVATLGRPRLLVPLSTRATLAAIAPDFDRLGHALDQLGLLGCYAYSPPTIDGRLAARMFAPSIGVNEDIANANSTACLGAHLAEHGLTEITVDMGDDLGVPATITAVPCGVTRPAPPSA